MCDLVSEIVRLGGPARLPPEPTTTRVYGMARDVLSHFFAPEDTDMIIDTIVYDGRNRAATATTIAGLRGGVMHNYVVTAVSLSGESNRSSPAVSVSTCPTAPTNFTSVAETSTSKSVLPFHSA